MKLDLQRWRREMAEEGPGLAVFFVVFGLVIALGSAAILGAALYGLWLVGHWWSVIGLAVAGWSVWRLYLWFRGAQS